MRCLLIVLMCTSLYAQHGVGTIIVVGYSPRKVVFAADSRQGQAALQRRLQAHGLKSPRGGCEKFHTYTDTVSKTVVFGTLVIGVALLLRSALYRDAAEGCFWNK
jgi:hypothetical protein